MHISILISFIAYNALISFFVKSFRESISETKNESSLSLIS